jgi:hypothetical protein
MSTTTTTTTRTGLLISRDLFFTSKVTGTARELGGVVEVVPDCAAAAGRVARGGIVCLFIDLAERELPLAALIADLPVEDRPVVIAFGSHVATARLQAARDAGCDEVLPRSRFSAELPELLRKHLRLPS